MNQQRYLIDTNVFIGLEDGKQVSDTFSSLIKLASKHQIKVLVHEASKDDIQRDKDADRKIVSLSKLNKFEIIEKIPSLTEVDLASKFGNIGKPNDLVDATLLHALNLDLADFLVTEDRGIHDRARKHAPDLERRILFVADAVSLITQTYEPVEVPMRYVEDVEAYKISKDDPIFDSLKEGYPTFSDWWQKKCVAKMRKCWVVRDENIAGIIVRKDETASDTDAITRANKILKICTFKVRPENRGIKLGELLLKQVFWHAQSNKYDLVYITTYPEQRALIDLLEYYGFVLTATKKDGERIYEKSFSDKQVTVDEESDLYTTARLNYPRFCARPSVTAYGIPIKEKYHDVLFPELKDHIQHDLFDSTITGRTPHLPGNTIRKVYLCRAKAKMEEAGSILFFYKGVSKDDPSQALTTIGILQDVSSAHSTSELMNLAGGRSVYSKAQLEELSATNDRPVRVINYLLAGYIKPPIFLNELQTMNVFTGHPPQSIFRIKPEGLEKLLNNLELGFDL